MNERINRTYPCIICQVGMCCFKLEFSGLSLRIVRSSYISRILVPISVSVSVSVSVRKIKFYSEILLQVQVVDEEEPQARGRVNQGWTILAIDGRYSIFMYVCLYVCVCVCVYVCVA